MYWPVPAIPPKGPQVTLLGSSLAPPSTDNDNLDPTPDELANRAEQLGLLPSELAQELELNRKEPWLGGFGYIPEGHSAARSRSPYDTTTVDSDLTPPNLAPVEVQPFDIGTKFTLSALDWQAEDYRGRAQRQNDVAMHKALEFEFWTGTLAKANGWPNPYLAAGFSSAGGKVRDVTTVGAIGPTITAAVAPTLPLTITLATNDTFVFTGALDPNTPDTFTIAPGTYTTLAELVTAVAGALSTADAAPFSTYVEVFSTGGKIVFTEKVYGTTGNGDTITAGDGGAAAIGFTALPATFASGAAGTPVSITKGLSLLQKAIADTGFGGQSMIHLQPEAAPNLLNTRRQGKFMLDQFDNIIVPGVGYPGTAPDGTAPATGTSWMYATDIVATRIQKDTTVYPATFAEALDRGQNGNPNTITFRAERLGAAYFDGSLLAAVLINLPS